MIQRASGSPLTHPGRPPAASGGLGCLVPDLKSGPSEGHLNMRDDQSQVGPLKFKNASHAEAALDLSRLQKERPHGWRGGPRQSRDERRFVCVDRHRCSGWECEAKG